MQEGECHYIFIFLMYGDDKGMAEDLLEDKDEKQRKDAGGNFTPFPLYKYNYLMMDQGSLYKIRTAPKHMPMQFDLNERFFHILFKSFETQMKHFTGGRPWMFPLGRWLHVTKPLLFNIRAVFLIIK